MNVPAPATTACPTCHGKRYVYVFRPNSGTYEDCPSCQPPPRPLPDWLRPAGQSILHPHEREPDGGARHCGGQA